MNNVISKTVIGGPDESAANNPLMNMDVFQFNDVFYFNAFGMSGKFVFRKTNTTNAYGSEVGHQRKNRFTTYD